VLDKERHTESVINIIGGYHEHNREYMLRMHGYPKGMREGVYGKIHEAGLTCVEMHKKLFGRQTYCWNGEFRYWVWDYGTWRIYVANGKGIAIEVDPSFDAVATMKVLRDYWEKFGV
jgi:hypothetical protein